MVAFWHQTDLQRCPLNGRYRGESGRRGDSPFWSRLTHLYGPAVRCKPDLDKWRVVLRVCILAWSVCAPGHLVVAQYAAKMLAFEHPRSGGKCQRIVTSGMR